MTGAKTQDLLRGPARNRQTATVLSATGIPGSCPEPDRRVGVRVAAREPALLGAWDLLTLLVAFGAIDLLGSAAGGRPVRLALALIGLAVIYGVGGYCRTSWLTKRQLELIRQLVLASTIIAWTAVLATLVLGVRADLMGLVICWAALPVAWYAGRQAARLVRRIAPERVLVVGSGSAARRAAEYWQQSGTGIVVGCVDDELSPDIPQDLPVLGRIDQLGELIDQAHVDRVIVTFGSRGDRDVIDRVREYPSFRGALEVVPGFFELVSPRARTSAADHLALMSIPGGRPGRGSIVLKRALDLVGATMLIVALSPLLLCVGVAILLDNGRPVLFRQRRIGRHGQPFSILKFRTLATADRGGANAPQEGEPEPIALHVVRAKREAVRRATRVGAFLRRTSLDELPQLFNVLLGQMSLVGPRPLSPREDAALEGFHTLRRTVRPGITGLWQVSGRNEIPWQTRVILDYAQVRHWSLWSDLELLAGTPRAVLKRRGAE